MVKGQKVPGPGIRGTCKGRSKEMRSVCLNVRSLNDEGGEGRLRELEEDYFMAAEGLGIDLSRPERGTDEDDARRQAGR